MTGGLWLGILIVAVGLGAIFSSLFYSLHELKRTRLEELSEGLAPSRRNRIRKILDDPSGHAVAVAFPRVICSMVAVIAAVYWVARLRGAAAPDFIDSVLGVAAASLMVWLFGLVIPSSIAARAGEESIIIWSGPLRALHVAAAPLRRVVTLLDELIGRVLGVREDPHEEAEAEVMSAVAEGQEEGRFDQFERDTIESVLRFSDKTVEQIMTPRTDMETMPLTSNLGEVTAAIRRSRHSRIPVYEGSPDRVVGIFYIKDLLKWLAGDKTRAGAAFDFRKLLRPASFVPETKTIREVLNDMREKKVHLMVVADEYGGVSGLVTIEDIVEQIIGDIRDEFEPSHEDASSDVEIDVKDQSAEIDARLYIREVNMQLRELGIELPESPDYDTVGGYVTVTLGRIPQPGETLMFEGHVITVLEAEPTHVERLRVEASKKPASDTDPAVAETAAVRRE
ncbi:MAG: hypothetical protein GIKADHBN_01964 [Phycisphaerales bacterium]|nr:hypothetical protein [Phycisphaerales bacterium]